MSQFADARITIDILSDVVCPWCVLGYRRLKRAIEILGLQKRVVTEWHPFELNPDMPASGENLRAHLANKYGTTLNGSIEARKRLTELGKAVGFDFDYFDDMQMLNTRKAHLLLQWAQTHGSQTSLSEAFFSAYFSCRRDISDTAVLLDLIDSEGLSPDEARSALDSTEANKALVHAELSWRSRGFTGVPVMVFQKKQVLIGAQEVETYIDILQSFKTITD